MENLPFAIWMTLFPVTNSLCNYFDAKKNEVNGTKKSTDADVRWGSLFAFIIWIAVGGYCITKKTSYVQKRK